MPARAVYGEQIKLTIVTIIVKEGRGEIYPHYITVKKICDPHLPYIVTPIVDSIVRFTAVVVRIVTFATEVTTIAGIINIIIH